jgi:DNA helicase-2/ATP-dependent DNA helicase PcrA
VDASLAAGGPEAVLAALDPEQREVALATRGAVCVLAGAGTGKTRAIAHRIAYGVRTGVVAPRHVLAVTFTTRAAGELRARLRQLAGTAAGELDQVQARTFHSAALRQLVYFWPRTVGGRPPAVLDSKLPLLSEAARGLGIPAGPAELRDAASEIEWAKASQIRADDYAVASAAAGRTPPLGSGPTAEVFAAYERLRRERHLADFESVLELTVAILAEHRPAAAEVASRYRYFVVDEFQDVNPLQKLLLDAWLDGRDDICVVGDPRQTIYSFTGATPAYLTGFTASYPQATLIRLVRNYRSTPQVVAVANRLSGAVPGRQQARRRPRAALPGAPLLAQGEPGPEPGFTGYPDDGSEAVAIARRAARLSAAGVPAREMAVLVRTNVQTERFERAFADAGIPCQVRGTERFFERAEVRQAMGMLRAAAWPGSGTGSAGPAATEVRHVLAGLGLTREPPPGRGSARDRWESLAALAQLAEDFCAASPGAGLADVAAELSRRAAIEYVPALSGVTVASLHAAKGLEWDVVFLPGLTEGNLPIVHAQSQEAIAEEQRLLYVGLTRARQRLYLSWALARSPEARPSRVPSRFLAGLRPPRARQARYGAPVPALGQEARALAGAPTQADDEVPMRTAGL